MFIIIGVRRMKRMPFVQIVIRVSTFLEHALTIRLILNRNFVNVQMDMRLEPMLVDHAAVNARQRFVVFFIESFSFL